MEWYQAVDLLKPHVVRIATPGGSGTGFLVSRSTVSSVRAIATADHVISEAQTWEHPIRIEHYQSGKSILLHHSERAILQEPKNDTAAIILGKPEPPFFQDSQPPQLIPEERFTKIGVEIGWLGFPAVSPFNLCFFSGRVSARIEASAYLVDGVAINGVSGGPAFLLRGKDVIVMGIVSAYIPNRVTGEALPGLAVIRDVSQFQQLAKTFKTVDDAQQKEEENRKSMAAQQSSKEREGSDKVPEDA